MWNFYFITTINHNQFNEINQYLNIIFGCTSVICVIEKFCFFFVFVLGSKEDKIPSKQIRIQVNMAHSSGHTERSIHEMLKDTPSMNESNSAIHSGIEGRVKHPNSLHIRTNSGKSTHCRSHLNEEHPF